jgi:hypothetical protein
MAVRCNGSASAPLVVCLIPGPKRSFSSGVVPDRETAASHRQAIGGQKEHGSRYSSEAAPRLEGLGSALAIGNFLSFSRTMDLFFSRQVRSSSADPSS